MPTIKLLITYDIKEGNEVHTRLKNEMISTYGWSKYILASDNNKYPLPNTTLVKEVNTNDAEKARQTSAEEFKTACKKIGAIWEKFIVLDYNGATFNAQ